MNLIKRFVITPINEWKQIGGKYNWYSFTICNLYFEYEKMLEGIEFSIIIFGIGIYIRFNLPASDKIFIEFNKKIKNA